jgi:hypothetical protein
VGRFALVYLGFKIFFDLGDAQDEVFSIVAKAEPSNLPEAVITFLMVSG